MANSKIYLGSTNIGSLFQGASDISIYLGTEKVYPLAKKLIATYSDSSTYNVDCNGNTALTTGETKPSGYVASAMTDAVIGSCVTTIGNRAFYGCSGLTSIDIPDSVTSIGSETFRFCSNLSNITIPNSVTSIGGNAFDTCSSLTSIAIPSGITNIANGVFQYCSGLTSVTIPDSVTSISSNAFYNCSSLTSIDIPSGVTSIGNQAFKNCTSLTSIDIPSGVTSIDYDAFLSCNNMNSITVNATTPPTLGSIYAAGKDRYPFDSTNNCPIYVPSGSVSVYQLANGWSTYASRYASRIQAIPNS